MTPGIPSMPIGELPKAQDKLGRRKLVPNHSLIVEKAFGSKMSQNGVVQEVPHKNCEH